MILPTWADIEFGFGNTDADAFRSFVHVVHAGVDADLATFAYPGVDGEFVQDLGRRGQTIIWLVETLYRNEWAMVTLEAAIRAKERRGAYRMTAHGRVRDAVMLVSCAEIRPLTAALPFDFGKYYELMFRDLRP